MDFKTKSLLTLTQQAGGILGQDLFLTQHALEIYGKIVEHDSNYYMARSDLHLWTTCAEQIQDYVPQGVRCIEFGPGDAKTVLKTSAIIGSLKSPTYQAVDINRNSVDQALKTVTALYQDIQAIGEEADIWQDPCLATPAPSLGIYAGGSIGNVDGTLSSIPEPKLTLALKTLINRAGRGWLLMSVDMWLNERSPFSYVSAYQGPLHSSFNLAIFDKMGDDFGLPIGAQDFDYDASFCAQSGAVQRKAIVKRAKNFDFAGQTIALQLGDRLHIDNSVKFKPETIEDCAGKAGLRIVKFWQHPETSMRLYLLKDAHADLMGKSGQRGAVPQENVA